MGRTQFLRVGFSMKRIALIGVILLVVGASSRADDAKALVDDLFGSRIKQAQASTSRLDDVALAKQMVDAAKAATDKAPLLIELCTRAGALAAKHSSGYATANEAYQLIEKYATTAVPNIEEAWMDILTKLSRVSDKATRDDAYDQLIARMGKAADRHASAGKFNEAMAIHRRALLIARRARHPEADGIQEAIVAIQEKQKGARRVEVLEEMVLRDASNQTALVELVSLYIFELDQAAKAKPFLARVQDAQLKRRLTAAGKPRTALTLNDYMDLGLWFEEKANKTTGTQRIALLRKSHGYLQHYLEQTENRSSSNERTKAMLIAKGIETSVRATGETMHGMPIPKLAVMQYRGGKVTKPNIPATEGLCLLTRFGGGWNNINDLFQLTIDRSRRWVVTGGNGTDSTNFDVLSLHFGRKKFPRVTYQTHEFKNNEKVRLIHSDEGLCMFSMINGAFSGKGEHARVFIDNDGYWYLFCETKQVTATQAVSITFPKSSDYKAKVSEIKYRPQGTPQKLIHKDQGFAYISGMGHAAQSDQEQAYLSINETDGHWYIHGKANSGFYVYVTTVEGLKW